jgi:hypothetical protein
MKFTITDCISRINQALNYPALSYEDVSHFFDQSIAELNTTLRISLPTFTEMRTENTFKIAEHPNVVVISDPSLGITHVDTVPEGDEVAEDIVMYSASDVSKLRWGLYVKKDGTWTKVSEAYGVKNGDATAYRAVVIDGMAVWSAVPYETVKEFDVTEYLPSDWIILFIIPYVCFKYAVRNGDSGALFSDEFTQGFQQLQTSYDVPNSVTLSKVAHLPAYKSLVLKNISNLSINVYTRCITEDMKVPNGIGKTYHIAVDTGGWGL